MPKKLSAEARSFWNKYIKLAKHLRKADSAMAEMCARHWALWCQAEKIASDDPLDKENRVAVNQYCITWKSLMERLALDPLGRARAGKGITRQDTEENPTEEFGIVG